MTHEPERDIEPVIAEWFRDHYGESNVETQVYQPDPYWFVDLVVDVGFATLFVEIENDADSVRPGVAQAQSYSSAEPDGIPMVVTPKGHIDETRVQRLRKATNVIIAEFDVENGEFLI